MQLQAYLNSQSISLGEFARRIGARNARTVQRYVKGLRIPSAAMMHAIQRETDGGKLPELAARLAANLAAFEEGTQLKVIDTERLARGIALAEYYLDEALRLFGIGPIDATLAHAEKLSNWLRDKYDEPLICAAVIQQYGPSEFKKMGGDQISDVIDALIRHNHLSPPLPKGGMVKDKKRRTAWRVLVSRD